MKIVSDHFWSCHHRDDIVSYSAIDPNQFHYKGHKFLLRRPWHERRPLRGTRFLLITSPLEG